MVVAGTLSMVATAPVAADADEEVTSDEVDLEDLELCDDVGYSVPDVEEIGQAMIPSPVDVVAIAASALIGGPFIIFAPTSGFPVEDESDACIERI
ncbi:hypothetical protein EA472_20990 [Natrarchaeobius oligotrophus]|uniref:Uncharacterized protein n=2 Tax=Natrarchaeobius TaxID=2501796 RepID=A0A3N6LZ05_NATCH|nr:hypothetical protein EA472_20990 [Natrarchaeobius chitinivorans]